MVRIILPSRSQRAIQYPPEGSVVSLTAESLRHGENLNLKKPVEGRSCQAVAFLFAPRLRGGI